MRGIFGLSLQQHLMAGAAVVAVASANPAQAQTKSFDVPAQPASQGIPAFAKQAGVQIIASGNLVRDRRTNAVKCTCTVEEGLRKLLDGTGLTAGSPGATGIITVVSAVGNANVAVTASDGDTDASYGDVAESERGIAEILVVGQKSQNIDIRRTENDAQPYVVFTGDDIQKSGVTDAEQFLRSRLPMNTQRGLNYQGRDVGVAAILPDGGIDLRGLGANQTLILIDGHPAPSRFTRANGFGQPAIDGIPPTAIERIEILPATAGGIYGGGATGGVVNIILKRDYSGLDLQISRGVTEHGGAGVTQLSASGGLSFNRGHTRIAGSLSHTDEDLLLDRDRPALGRNSRALFDQFASATSSFIPSGTTPNVCAAVDEFTTSCDPTITLVLDPAFGGSSLGSSHTTVPTGYRGFASDSAAALLANAGNYNLGIPRGAGSLLPRSKKDAAFLSLRQDLNSRIQLFFTLNAERSKYGSLSSTNALINIPADSPDNPFQQDILVNLPVPTSFLAKQYSSKLRTKLFDARVGALVKLPLHWKADIEGGWARSSFSGFNWSNNGPTFDGLANLQAIALTDPDAFPPANVDSNFDLVRSESSAANITTDLVVRTSGPLFQLPGGAVTLTVSAERRRDRTEKSINDIGTGAFNFLPSLFRNQQSLYAEARAPIVGESSGVPFISELELMSSVRYDKYDIRTARFVFGPSRSGPFPTPTFLENTFSSTNYTLGVRYKPFRSLTVRGSYGTGFYPPNLNNLIPSPFKFPLSSFVLSRLNDPLRGGTHPSPPVLQITGGNPDLRPEKSKSYSLGMIFEPTFVPGFRLSADYVHIKKSDEFSFGPPVLFIFDNFPDRIVRAPLTPADQALGYTGGRVTAIDASAINVASSTVAAYDFQADYTVTTQGWGHWRFYAIATLMDRRTTQALPGFPEVDRVGFADGNLRWRGNYGIDWRTGPWSVSWNAQYYHKYSVCSSFDSSASCADVVAVSGSSHVGSQTYHDVQVTYDFSPRYKGGVLGGTSISFGVQNLFDKRPPSLAADTTQYSMYGDPRLRRFTLTLRKHIGE